TTTSGGQSPVGLRPRRVPPCAHLLGEGWRTGLGLGSQLKAGSGAAPSVAFLANGAHYRREGALPIAGRGQRASGSDAVADPSPMTIVNGTRILAVVVTFHPA